MENQAATMMGSNLNLLISNKAKIWLTPCDESTVIKDSSNRVSSILDISGNKNHFTQSNNTYKPIWSANGITSDGVNDIMKSPALSIPPSYTIFIVLKYLSGTTTCFGTNTGSMTLGISNTNYQMWNSSNVIARTSGVDIVQLHFNGSGSSFSVNSTKSSLGSVNVTITDLSMFGGYYDYYYTSFILKEFILFNSEIDTITSTLIYNNLKLKYGI
ncbi:MAG: hypothetical protein WCJ61_01735 [Paludibacter sp.]